MKRWMILVVALVAGAFAPAQAMDPDVPGSGTGPGFAGCGATEPVTPLAVGTVGDPGDYSDWYDASFPSGSRTLELRSVFVPYVNPFGALSGGVELRVHAWNTSTNDCWLIAQVFCVTAFSVVDDDQPCQPHNAPSSGGAATYTFPAPGNYQVEVRAARAGRTVKPANYIIREK